MDLPQEAAKLSSKRLLAKITVRGLFGHYDYDLPCPVTKQIPNSQFTILYGDNGSGKTTILRLLYAILSAEDGKGYRTFLPSAPFREFSVYFSDALSVSATRSGDEIRGTYSLSLRNDKESLAEVELRADEALEISARAMSRRRFSELAQFLKLLSEYTPRLTFLPEHRRMLSNPFAGQEEAAHSYVGQLRLFERHEVLHSTAGRSPENTLSAAFDRAARWINRQVVGASTLSDQGAAQIYAEVVARIAGEPESVPEDLVTTVLEGIEDAATRSIAYSRFGLTLSISAPLEEIKKALRLQSSPNIRSVIVTVLKPYVDGLVSRLDALSATYELVSRFVDNINSLFRDIALEFQLERGFRVVSKNSSNPLPPNVLSSGEQHILLLMCNTLSSRDSPCLVLIDEPELSLNIKWQRQLIKTLLDCTTGSDVQFIAATHSFELLSHYRENVVALTNLANGQE